MKTSSVKADLRTASKGQPGADMNIDFSGSLRFRDLQRAQWMERRPRVIFGVLGALILVLMVWAGVHIVLDETVPPWLRVRFVGFFALLAVWLWLLPRLSVYRLWKRRDDLHQPVSGGITEDFVDYHGPAVVKYMLGRCGGRSSSLHWIFWIPIVGPSLWVMGSGRREWREYKRRRDEFTPMTAEDVKRWRASPSNVGEKWDVFVSYEYARPIVLLYKRNGFVYLFPRSLFKSDDDWNTFLDLVKRKMPR